jgi:tetratricopeptide (TPR) repeat protein
MIFLVALLSFCFSAFADECPYGCFDSDENPELAKVEFLFRKCLKDTKMNRRTPMYPKLGEWYELIWGQSSPQSEFVRIMIPLGSQNSVETGYELSSYPVFLDGINRLKQDIDLHAQLFINHYNELIKEQEAVEKASNRYPSELSSYGRERIQSLSNSINTFQKEYPQRLEALTSTESQIDEIFCEIIENCATEHESPEAFYQRGLFHFYRGLNLEAFEDMLRYLKTNTPEDNNTYAYKGKIESELGLYDQAIYSLSRALEKNPDLEDLYFERAVAYFETGKFTSALQDFKASHFKSTPLDNDQSNFDFATGLIAIGALEGIVKETTELAVSLPGSLLSLFENLSKNAVNLIASPAEMSNEYVRAAKNCLNYVCNHTPKETLYKLVPELQELITNIDHLSEKEQGLLTGKIIVKYGIGIFATRGSATAVKAYRDLKKANQLLFLEKLSISTEQSASIFEKIAQRELLRKQNAGLINLKIHADKQGKHIRGHKNFPIDGTNSILEHKNPQILADKFHGKGLKENHLHPGMPGAKEVVNFHEPIGYYYDLDTHKLIPTSWGKIHYAKDGVHIVPTKPRKWDYYAN